MGKPISWSGMINELKVKTSLRKESAAYFQDEAYLKIGISGILLFNVSQGIPNGLAKYNSDLHHEMIKHAAAECERLGLSFGVHNCDGWSSSGGPWITPWQSMKMVVWSEIFTQGGDVEIELPQPTARKGYYEDIAVLAYPSLKSEIMDAENPPVIQASDGGFMDAFIPG